MNWGDSESIVRIFLAPESCCRTTDHYPTNWGKEYHIGVFLGSLKTTDGEEAISFLSFETGHNSLE